MSSVRDWALNKDWEYRFIGDEILDCVPEWYRAQAQGRMPIIIDLARLVALRDALNAGASSAAWVDADVAIFDPAGFELETPEPFAFSREIWMQPASAGGGLKTYRGVHNAVCVFRPGNSMLDFYIDACQSVMRRVDGGVPNQIVGPKLLGALHNIIGFSLIDDVGMISPLVARDVSTGGGPALEALIAASPSGLRAVNLCASLVGRTVDGIDIDDALLEKVAARILGDGTALFGRRQASD